MKMHADCLPCVVSQAVKTADLVGIKEKSSLMRRVFTRLSQADFERITTPELFGDIFMLIKEEIGDPDPYRAKRAYYNNMFLRRLPALRAEIDRTENPFLESIRLAIIGNIIDFGPAHNWLLEDIEARVDELKRQPLHTSDSAALKEAILGAKTLLYLGDNCGEICFDRLLIERIKALNPACRVFFAVRGEPVVNDSVEEDAYAVGMDAVATIVSNGDHSMGTVLPKTSPAFQEIYREADVVIAKGQANYECLSEADGNVYFLLMTKCHVIADDVGVPVGSMVCMSNERRKSMRLNRMNGANQ